MPARETANSAVTVRSTCWMIGWHLTGWFYRPSFRQTTERVSYGTLYLLRRKTAV